MAPIDSLKVTAPTDKEIIAHPREFALYKQLTHGKADKIDLKVRHFWLSFDVPVAPHHCQLKQASFTLMHPPSDVLLTDAGSY